MAAPESKSFTIQFSAIARDIISDIGISLPGGLEQAPGAKFQLKALWDTGATHCVITKKTAQLIGLKPIGITPVTHAGGNDFVNEYLVNIYLPNLFCINTIRVTECSDEVHFDVIIGMNVITQGDFSITNIGNKTCVSFRMPSIKRIDYVEETKKFNKFSKEHSSGIGRNDLCPCDSGLKYKNCCGKGF